MIKNSSSFLESLNSAEKFLLNKRIANSSLFSLLRSPKSFFYVSSFPAASVSISSKKQIDAASDTSSIFGIEMSFLTTRLKALLKSSHPLLDTVSKYYLSAEGKKFRPLVVLLMSRMANPIENNEAFKNTHEYSRSLTLAMVTELIHTASLMHDDVIDDSPTRRGLVSAHLQYGNKMAILAGDYLLSRASVALARLRETRVAELIAESIGSLVEGEVLQMNDSYESLLFNDINNDSGSIRRKIHFDETNTDKWLDLKFNNYITKCYNKTASLIAKSCQAAIILGYDGPEKSTYEKAAYSFGKNLGIAFQIIDDRLDFTANADEFGKPSKGFDLELGLATAPVLFAFQEYPLMKTLIERRFSGTYNDKKDSLQAFEWVLHSKALEKSNDFAKKYIHEAIQALCVFPDSKFKVLVSNIAEKVLCRGK